MNGVELIGNTGNLHLSPSVRVKPGSHRRIVKEYRSKTGKDHDILRESV